MSAMNTNQDSLLITKLLGDLLQARKDGDVQKKDILQSVLTRITNAQAVAVDGDAPVSMAVGVGSTEVERQALSEAEIRVLIQQEIDELNQALESMISHPGHPYVAELEAKAAILSQYV